MRKRNQLATRSRRVVAIAALEHARERYRARAEGILKTGVTDENRTQVLSTVKKHVDALEALRETAA
jgi:hypothetical protein